MVFGVAGLVWPRASMVASSMFLRLISVAVPFLVGLSPVLLSAHFLTDVVAWLGIGGLFACLAGLMLVPRR